MPGPANDDFVNATVVVGDSGTVSGIDLTDATVQAGEETFSGFITRTVWYGFTAPTKGHLVITNAAASAFALLWTGASVATLGQLNGVGPGSGQFAQGVEAGATYWLSIADDGSSVTPSSFDWRFYSPPDNDDIANAVLLEGASGSVAGTTLGATLDTPYDPLGDAEGLYDSVWYKLQLPGQWSPEWQLRVAFDSPADGFRLLYPISTLPGKTLPFNPIDGFSVWDTIFPGDTDEFQIDPPADDRMLYIGVGDSGSPADFSFSWHLITPPTRVFGGSRFYESPPWRFIVTDLDTNTLTFLDHIGMDRSVTITRAAARVISVRVPSDNPEVNIPAVVDGDPFVSEGTRLIYAFRRESRINGAEHPWVIRAAGIVLDVTDAADSDAATSTVTAYDPWKYLYRRPVLLEDGSYPKEQGRIYPAGATANEIIVDQLDLAILESGFFTDYGQTAYYGGTIETCDPLPDDGDGVSLRVTAGTSIGELLDTLVATGTCDVVFDPIYDPVNRPGILCEMSIYQRAGTFRPNAVMGWDRWPRSVVQLSRQIDGTQRANRMRFFTSQGLPVPEQDDAASIAKFGDYWASQNLSGALSLAAVRTIAERQLALLKAGQITYSLTPAAERAPLLFEEYREADTVPIYASERFRAPVDEQVLRIESIPIVIGDDELERVNAMLVSFVPESGS